MRYLLSFDQYDVGDDEGSRGAELRDALVASGYDLRPHHEDGVVMDCQRQLRAGFALAERITGVRLTPEIFASAEFLCGFTEQNW